MEAVFRVKYYFSLCVVLLCVCVQSTDADIVYLKNNQKIEGVVKKQTASQVYIDVGAGVISFGSDEVVRIEKGTLTQSESEVTQDDSDGAAEIRKVNALLAKVRLKRRKLALYKSQQRTVKGKRQKIEKGLIPVYRDYEKAYITYNKKYGDKEKGTSYEQRDSAALVGEINMQMAKIKSEELRIEECQREYEGLSRKVSDTLFEVTAIMKNLSLYYEGTVRRYPERKETKHMQQVVNIIDQFNKDWKTKNVPLRVYGGNFIVDVRINDALTVPLIVDTGASSMCISRRTANTLGLSKSDEVRTLTVSLANGTQAEGKMVFLKSVNVGGMEARDVPAVILDITKNDETEGLLGMTYLGNFLFHIDAKAKVLMIDSYEG